MHFGASGKRRATMMLRERRVLRVSGERLLERSDDGDDRAVVDLELSDGLGAQRPTIAAVPVDLSHQRDHDRKVSTEIVPVDPREHRQQRPESTAAGDQLHALGGTHGRLLRTRR